MEKPSPAELQALKDAAEAHHALTHAQLQQLVNGNQHLLESKLRSAHQATLATLDGAAAW